MLVDDSDLDVFVTRPDIRPPKFNVHFGLPELKSPGYWFVAPYASLQDTYSANLYQPSQTGPHIYDGYGNLVWSGAHLTDPNRPTFDFKAIDINGTQHLSFLVLPRKSSSFHPEGVGLILDPSLTVCREIKSRVGSGIENMHEFNVIENGRRALMLTYQEHAENVKLPGIKATSLLAVGNYGFVELDTATGEVVFEWWSQNRIHVNETSTDAPFNMGPTWDWLHLNSVDKNDQGDYLLSGRFTDTVYKVSGRDGSIIWRLGGKFSSFEMEGFNFSAQHDARFRDYEFKPLRDDSMTYISLMDNAGGGSVTTSNYSMGLLVGLNTATMKATLVKAFPRPDHALTLARGNLQTLPNANVIAGWSENAYSTEFTADGRQVLSTNFTSHRLVTYRIYKANFTSAPIDNPAIIAFVYGELPLTSTTAVYVSWNGATEVSWWRFFAAQDSLDGKFAIVGTAAKQGFETVLMTSGYQKRVYAEAMATNGTVLGRSPVEDVIQPNGWTATNNYLGQTRETAFENDASEPCRCKTAFPASNRILTVQNQTIRTDVFVASPIILLLLLGFFALAMWPKFRRKGLWPWCL